MQSYKKNTISKDTKQSSDHQDGWILQSEKKKRSPSITEETENSIEENEAENLMDYKNRYLNFYAFFFEFQ